MRKIFFIAIIVICLGAYASIHDNQIILIIGCAIACISSLLLPTNQSIYLIAALIPPNRILTLGPISTPVMIIIVILLKLLITRRIKIEANFAIWTALYILFGIISLVFVESNLITFIKDCSILIYLYHTFKNSCSNLSKYLISVISYSCIVSSIIIALFNPLILLGSERFGFTDSGQNVLGIICGSMILLNAILLFKEKYEFKRVLIIILLLILGIFTGSRSFLLEIGIGISIFILYIITHLKQQSNLQLLIGFFLIGFTLLMLYEYSSLFSSIIERNLNRYNSLNQKDVSNGRFDIWNNYINLFIEHPRYLWLGGMNRQTLNLGYVAHNLIIEHLAYIGIIGNCIIAILYRYIYKIHIRTNKLKYNINYFTIAPLVSFIGAGMVSHTLLALPQTIILYITLFTITKENDKKNSLDYITRTSRYIK